MIIKKDLRQVKCYSCYKKGYYANIYLNRLSKKLVLILANSTSTTKSYIEIMFFNHELEL